MKREAVLLLLLAAGLSCRRAAEPTPAAQPKAVERVAPAAIEPDLDVDNLLNVAYGASVVSRTAELNLDNSAAHAIDGISTSYWCSPPGGPDQTLVFSLLAPARITRVGITSLAGATQVPARVRFESSRDGRRWHEVVTIEPKATMDPQLFDVEPFVARYLRATTLDGDSYYTILRSIQAIGTEIEPPQPRPLAGCWRVGGKPARFVQDGARVAGAIATDPPTFLEGGTDGRVARVLWTRGPMWGHAAITMSPDGGAITGIEFHEAIDVKNLGGAWFGTRCDGDGAAGAPTPGIAPGRLLERTGRFPLFGLAFDPADRVIPAPSRAALAAAAAAIAADPSHRFRVVAHELRGPSPEQNQRRSEARIEAIRAALRDEGADLSRVDFVSAGSNWDGPPISYAIQKLLGSGVDLERIR